MGRCSFFKRAPCAVAALWSLTFVLFFVLPGISAGTVQIRLQRDFGVGLGDWIQGQFTLIGTGSSDIIEMRLYFNDQLVSSSSGIHSRFPSPRTITLTVIQTSHW